jgi:arylamine N-acetyltransferase
MFALAQTLGFDARRIAGSMLVDETYTHDDNHGSVIVTLDGIDYLVDARSPPSEPCL